MIQTLNTPMVDEWSEWLLHRRHGDDSNLGERIDNSVNRIRNKVLDGAKLRPNQILADIGSGTGLIGFEAIQRVGPTLKVLFADVSPPLLKHCESEAVNRGVREQCDFIQCPADRLAGIADASVDVVTTRAVLAYVNDKPAALKEFLRVLKPGGRISIAEPIFRDDAFENVALRELLEKQPPASTHPILPLLHRWRRTQFPDTMDQVAKNPLTNYCERDLFRYVASAGFSNVRMEFHVEVLPSLTDSWEALLGTSMHPLAPSLGPFLATAFTPDEAKLFEQVMRPIVEASQSTTTERNAYLTATKPLNS